MWRSLHKRANKGFTLVELLVVILIVGILAGVAVPIYMNQKTRAYRTSAVMDGHATAATISSGLFGLTSFGDANGTIVVDASVKPATVTVALGGSGSTSSPSVLYAAMTAGSTASGVTYANTTSWCLDIANNNQHVIYTEAGITTAITSCGLTSGTNSVAVATGGVLTSDAIYYYRAFTAGGALVISGKTLAADILVVAGGAGGGSSYGGGGGGGGFLEFMAQSLTVGSYPVVVGAGGSGGGADTNGQDSSFGVLTSAVGGGKGGVSGGIGTLGGSGGGGSNGSATPGVGTAGQGFAGGTGAGASSGGGGGAGGIGGNGQANLGGLNGPGKTSVISGGATTGLGALYSGNYYFSAGGLGVYTAGVAPAPTFGGTVAYTAGSANTGQGASENANGGSGTIIIRYLRSSVGG